MEENIEFYTVDEVAKVLRIYPQYKRQMEAYQWLLLQNGNKVSKIGYFLFAQVNKKNGFAEGKLSFDLTIEPLEGDSLWVEGALANARKAIDGPIPAPGEECPYCQFVKSST